MADPDAAGKALLGLVPSRPILTPLAIDTPRQDLIATLNILIEEYNKRELQLGWKDWVPTLTNITLGNGTLIAKYKEIGSIIFFEVTLTFGSTTALATVSNYTQSPRVSLPFKGVVNSWSGLDTTNYSGAVMPFSARMSYDASTGNGTGSSTAPQWYDDESFYDSNISAASTNLHDVGDRITWNAAYQKA